MGNWIMFDWIDTPSVNPHKQRNGLGRVLPKPFCYSVRKQKFYAPHLVENAIFVKNKNMEAVLNKPFNAAQIELIQLLANDLENSELAELRKMLIAFRFKLVEERAERIAQAKGWTEEKINLMSQEHHRTPYTAKEKNKQNKQP